MQVLLVEDDDRVAAALGKVLQRHGFHVTRAEDLGRARAAMNDTIDLVLLDLMLPDGDGLSMCAHIRAVSNVPILITSARREVSWRLHGLNLGADDYLVKPYDVRELVARMSALARRSRPSLRRGDGSSSGAGTVVGSRGVTIDLRRREVTSSGRPVPLTRKEFDVLAELAASPGIVVRRERLLSSVWQSQYEQDGHTLNVHIATVRSKVGDPDLIETVRGVGYRLAAG